MNILHKYHCFWHKQWYHIFEMQTLMALDLIKWPYLIQTVRIFCDPGTILASNWQDITATGWGQGILAIWPTVPGSEIIICFIFINEVNSHSCLIATVGHHIPSYKIQKNYEVGKVVQQERHLPFHVTDMGSRYYIWSLSTGSVIRSEHIWVWSKPLSILSKRMHFTLNFLLMVPTELRNDPVFNPFKMIVHIEIISMLTFPFHQKCKLFSRNSHIS